jgi:uncharacterized membrane-anchored protein YitT (DUF2179 family)
MYRIKKVLTYVVIMLVAMVGALNYELFVFPNQFAPAGINGICTMIQYLGGISVGYLSLLINIPLAIAVFFKVSRSLALRTMVYVSVFSLVLVVFDHVDISHLAYDTQSSAILGPLVAGIINGSCYSLLIRASAYSGGMDFVASLIHKFKPNINFFWTVFALNIAVAAISFFVYGYKLEPVLLCIIYSFTTSTVSDKLNKSGRSAVRFEIVTDHPEAISQAIIQRLHHSATLVPGKGMYQGKETNLLICVVNRTQAATLSAIIRSFPGTFAVMSQVSEVMGNFQKFDDQGNIEVSLLDEGDGTGI